jgi:hypothetical protein
MITLQKKKEVRSSLQIILYDLLSPVMSVPGQPQSGTSEKDSNEEKSSNQSSWSIDISL